MRKFILISALLSIPFIGHTQQFTLNTQTFDAVGSGSMDLGDYDNDGDLDIAINGQEPDPFPAIVQIFRNNGDDTYTEVFTSDALGGAGGSIKWGDYDNDSYLDLLISGSDADNGVTTTILKNNGDESFTVQETELQGIRSGQSEWADIDNDGDLDIVMIGTIDFNNEIQVAKIYVNKGQGLFDELENVELVAQTQTNLSLGDINNDGWVDIFTSGLETDKIPAVSVARIYINQKDLTFLELEGHGIADLANSSSDWGDYDNDGDVDLLVNGVSFQDPFDEATIIYENNGDLTFSEVDVTLEPADEGMVKWADMNNDGNRDAIVIGRGNVTMSGVNFVTEIYEGDGSGNFSAAANTGLPGAISANLAVGDLDGDGDLEIVIIGDTPVANKNVEIYENTGTGVNNPPGTPANLKSIIGGDGTTLTWSPSTDSNTPSDGLSYNVYLRSDTETIVNSNTISGGIRKVVDEGNASQNNFRIISELEPGTYFWSVQAVDPTFASSAFAAEVEFDILFTPDYSISPGLRQGDSKWFDMDLDGDLDFVIGGNDIEAQAGMQLYVNESGEFEPMENPFPNIFEPEIDWGDYDNDGDFDLIFASNSGTQLFKNEDSVFTRDNNDEVLPAFERGSIEWGDFDNDNDLDIQLTGQDIESNSITKIFENTDGIFSEAFSGSFTGVSFGHSNWADIDGDGDLDLLISGVTGQTPSTVTEIYLNNTTSFDLLSSTIQAFGEGSSSDWGDYDNDGDLDLVISGSRTGDTPLTAIYQNDDLTFNMVFSTEFPEVASGSVEWIDFNKDGLLDVFVAGTYLERVSQLFINTGSNFELVQEFEGAGQGFSDWGDYDSDGDLDLLLSGQREDLVLRSTLFENLNTNDTPDANANSIPSPPSELTSEYADGILNLEWTKGADTETSANTLSHSVFITHISSGNNVILANSMEDGTRKIQRRGNSGFTNSHIIERDLEPGDYEWGVQTIDNSFAGSTFATGEFHVNFPPEIFGQETVIIEEETSFEILLTLLQVEDPDNTYPDDFTLDVLEGDDYSLEGATITPVTGFSGILEVPLTVNDGTDDSEIFNFEVTVEAVTALEDGISDNNLGIYPNPSKNLFTVVFESRGTGSKEIRVLDLMGKEVYRKTIKKFVTKVEVSSAKWEEGVYILQVTQGKTSYQKRIVKDGNGVGY